MAFRPRDLVTPASVLIAALALGVMASWGGAVAQTPVASSPPPDSAWTRYPAGRSVRIENAAAIVLVAPQRRRDVAIAVINPGPLPDPSVRLRGDRLDIDGGFHNRIRDCNAAGGPMISGVGRLATDQLPVIYIRTPADMQIAASGAVRLFAEPTVSAKVSVAGCASALLGPVMESLEAAVAGSGHISVGPSHAADVAVAGSGHVDLGPVSGPLDVSIAGSGRVAVATVDGPVRIAIQGDGGVVIGAGEAERMRVAIAGSGDVTFPGVVGDLSAAIAGDGHVRVGLVRGVVSSRVAGGGAVETGRSLAAPAPAPPAPPAAGAVPPPPRPPAPPSVQ